MQLIMYVKKAINNLKIFFLNFSYCYNQAYQKLTFFNTYLISLFLGAMVTEAPKESDDSIFLLHL